MSGGRQNFTIGRAASAIAQDERVGSYRCHVNRGGPAHESHVCRPYKASDPNKPGQRGTEQRVKERTRDHSGAKLRRGICQECAETYYPVSN